MIGFNESEETFVLDYGQELAAGFERWMVKAPSLADPAEIGAEEQAYAAMARAAGLQMAPTRLFDTRKGNRLFATKRFDRTPAGRRHMHTASGLLNASHREASLNYEQLHKLTLILMRDSGEVLFNVFARNRDDHAKNHAFLMNSKGQWTLSPAYDLTFSAGTGGEHSAAIAGEGRNPGLSYLLAVAKTALISPAEAKNIIDEVRTGIESWPSLADEAGVPKPRIAELDRVLNGNGSA